MDDVTEGFRSDCWAHKGERGRERGGTCRLLLFFFRAFPHVCHDDGLMSSLPSLEETQNQRVLSCGGGDDRDPSQTHVQTAGQPLLFR